MWELPRLMRLRDCAALALSLVASGCSTAAPPVTPRASMDESFRVADADLERGPREVTPAEARDDLAFAARVFDQAYAGVEGRSRVPSAAALRDADAWIAAHDKVEPRAFAELLRRVFWQPDGHLAFGWEGASPHRFPTKAIAAPQVTDAVVDRVDRDGAWIGRDRLVDCPTHELLPTLEGRFLLGVFEPPGRAGSLSCSVEGPSGERRQLALELRPVPESRTSEGAAVSLQMGELPLLRIRTFDNAAREPLRSLPAIARRLRDEAAFIVDLRGNTGGNYAFAEDFILELTSAELLRLDEREVVSVAAAEGRGNEVRRRLLRGDVPSSARPWFLAQLRRTEQTAARLRAGAEPRVEVSVSGATVRGRAPHPLRARAVFLVDGDCASACEMTVALARQIPGVVIAGQNTRGGMSAGEVAMFRMPRSGLTITLGTRAFRDPLGDFRETRGFLPDVWMGKSDEKLAHLLAKEPLPPPRRRALSSLASRAHAPLR